MTATPKKRFLTMSKPYAAACGVLLLVALSMAAIQPAQAQEFEGMKGRLTDAEGKPLVGHRVVFRPVEGAETFVSGVSDSGGNYVISLPLGGQFLPVALVTPNGGRVELPPDQLPLEVRKGGGRNIQLQPGMTTENAGNADILVAGRITDVAGRPLAGYRVIFKLDDEIFLSKASLANGEYTIMLRERKLFAPLAAIAPNGLRIPLQSEPPLQPRTNTRRDFQLPAQSPATNEPPFESAHRLFLSFAEDVSIPGFIHEQSQLQVARIDSRDVLVSRLILAAQLPGLADTELGLKAGYGSFDPRTGPDVSGLTDLELWAKLNLGQAMDGTRYAVGFVLTTPSGEDAPGLGDDAWATKFFAAGRRNLGKGLLTGNVGLRITGDGTSLGVRRSGRLSGSAAAGWITAVHPNVNVVVEAAVESERYSGADAEFSLLTGVNWRISDMTIRAAVAGGLTDSSPDFQFLAGIAFEF